MVLNMVLSKTTAGTMVHMPYQAQAKTREFDDIYTILDWCSARWPGGLGESWDYMVCFADDSNPGAGIGSCPSNFTAGFATMEDHVEFCLAWL